MNNTYPIGTPLTFVWRFLKPNNEPFYFDPDKHSFRLRYYTGRGYKEVESFVISADLNALTWTIPADDTLQAGNYSYVLDVFADGVARGHFAYNNAFTLYKARMADVPNAEQAPAGETVNLLSVAEFHHFAGGDSAYRIAVNHGYEGTEEEWLNDPINGIKGKGITSVEIVGDYSEEDGATNTYRISMNDGTEFDFDVKNGKDAKSIKSIEQTTTSELSEGVNVITITFSDGETVGFEVKNGARGNSGYSGAAEDLEVVNDLDADDPDADASKALSAYQGHVLDGKVEQLGQDVEDTYGKYVQNRDFVEAHTDANDNVLYGVKADGDFYFGAGVPTQVQEALDGAVDGKVDKVEGQSLIDSGFASSQSVMELHTWLQVIVDGEDKVIAGIKKDGSVFIGQLAGNAIQEAVDSEFPNKVTLGKFSEQSGSLLWDGEPIEGDSTGILGLNPEKEVLPKIQNLKRRYISYGGGANDNPPVFSLIHYSDAHGDNDNLRRIQEFRRKYSSYINDVLDTGDLTQYPVLPDALSEIPNFLRVVGNHDTTERVGTPPNHKWVYLDSKDCYDFFLKDYIGNWNVTQPANAEQNGYCYYYKDYPTSNVRLVCLDGEGGKDIDDNPVEHWDNTQLTWLQGVLADAKANGLHVIIAVHRPPFSINPIAGNTFDSVDLPNGAGVRPLAGLVDAVNTFKSEENGITGNFVCYLCGHIHQDCMGLGQGNASDQLLISIACASSGQSATVYGELNRVAGNKTQDCFNLVGVDTTTKTLKLVRIGAQYDRHMKKRDTLCWDYGTNTLVFCG